MEDSTLHDVECDSDDVERDNVNLERTSNDEGGKSNDDNMSNDENLQHVKTVNEGGQSIQVMTGEKIEPDENLLSDYESDTDEIDLVHCKISSLPSLHLGRFTHLQKLCLRQNIISHIELPSILESKLRELDLYDNQISHIRGLEGFSELISLDVSFNRIKRIKRLPRPSRLEELYFVQNRIQKIEGLDGLTNLRILELGSNQIRQIEGLDGLIALEQLWLGKNKISNLSGLSHLHNLKLLSIQANRLTTLEGLDLPSLTELYLSHNSITSLESLTTLPNLSVLDISNNPIKSLKGIRSLTKLTELWANNCQLDDIEEIARECGPLEILNTVYFEGNPLQSRQPVLYRGKIRLALPRIKQIDASGCFSIFL